VSFAYSENKGDQNKTHSPLNAFPDAFATTLEGYFSRLKKKLPTRIKRHAIYIEFSLLVVRAKANKVIDLSILLLFYSFTLLFSSSPTIISRVFGCCTTRAATAKNHQKLLGETLLEGFAKRRPKAPIQCPKGPILR